MNNESEPHAIYLSSFFSKEDIVIEQMVHSPYNLVHGLVSRIVKNHLPNTEIDPIVDAVLHRERTSATVIGEGVALPHARIENLTRPYLAVGIYPAGLSFADTPTPVRLIFLLLVPESQPARYLQILRALANLLRDPDAVNRLSEMSDVESVMHFFRRSEMKLPEYICAGDLMSTSYESLHQGEALSKALDIFMLQHKVELPIVDSERHLLGVIDTHALLSCFIPKGIRKLFPVFQASPTPTMEPLAVRLRAAEKTKVREAMNTDFCVCNVETSALEIAADLAERNACKCYVVDKDKRLVGVIPVAQLFSRILKD
ncbi:MAG: PTS sugar transporter subunit IIA [Kiritimatiellia bacterium]